MASDRSRRTDPPHFGYTGVVAQQGRVILDRDFNAQQGFEADRNALDALSFVGPSGTPDDAFRIFTDPSAAQIPNSPVSPPTSPPSSNLNFDFTPGVMYVGGIAVTLPPSGGAPYSYAKQPDWPAPPVPTPTPQELVYLDV